MQGQARIKDNNTVGNADRLKSPLVVPPRSTELLAQSPGLDIRQVDAATLIHLQRCAGNESVCNLLDIQRKPAAAAAAPTVSSPPVSPDVVERDIESNKALYLIGLNSAAIRFGKDVAAQLESEKIDDRSRLWFNFGRALFSLSLPLLCPVVGLNPVGMALIVGTFALVMDPALEGAKGKSKEPALEKAITDFFIAPKGSVAAAVDGINGKTAAAGAIGRHKEASSDLTRIAIAKELFQDDVLQGYGVKAEKVNAHAHDGMMRMWNLQTVADRAQQAFGEECVGGTCPPASVDAFFDKVHDVFPDMGEQMRRYMPERWDYWAKTKKGRLNSFDVGPFRNDLQMLTEIVSAKEFGTKNPHYSEQPALWQGD